MINFCLFYTMIFECLGTFHFGVFFFFFLKASLMARGLQSYKLFSNVFYILEEYTYALWKSKFRILRLLT